MDPDKKCYSKGSFQLIDQAAALFAMFISGSFRIAPAVYKCTTALMQQHRAHESQRPKIECNWIETDPLSETITEIKDINYFQHPSLEVRRTNINDNLKDIVMFQLAMENNRSCTL